ncbi:hypothetical protein WMY93_031546 [Mugilogobius chulae]|uniref:Formimidoyltransferase-cyclodeaminase n=1 Tax=Mugilogobius chulae TaxID=88201 RepID=A0AAW0MHH2_9GOBI
MSRLVECVPNFSEGRTRGESVHVIESISLSISQTDGVTLLDVDPGVSTNRTVYTFVGSPEAVVMGALNAAQTAFQLIDMSQHKGEHPRLGALDVCPFVPVQNVSMDDCVKCAQEFGLKLSQSLNVPVYLYGAAAQCESRRSLPSVRAGEYEGLEQKPGSLKKLQALGWFLDESNLAQVSTNILDFEETPVHRVYEEVCAKAKVVSKLGLDSLGPFNPRERIIEYMVNSHDASGLSSLPLRDFVLSVGARSAAPGGGSVSAAVAAMGAALGSMVGQMSYGKRQFESLDSTMRRLIPPFHQNMRLFCELVDQDAHAFSSYMAALKMPKNSPEEQDSSFVLAQKVSGLWIHLKELCEVGNVSCLSDAQVAAKALETAVFGAYFNVMINLRDIKDQDFRLQTEREARALLQEAKDNAQACLCACEQRSSQTQP